MLDLETSCFFLGGAWAMYCMPLMDDFGLEMVDPAISSPRGRFSMSHYGLGAGILPSRLTRKSSTIHRTSIHVPAKSIHEKMAPRNQPSSRRRALLGKDRVLRHAAPRVTEADVPAEVWSIHGSNPWFFFQTFLGRPFTIKTRVSICFNTKSWLDTWWECQFGIFTDLAVIKHGAISTGRSYPWPRSDDAMAYHGIMATILESK